MISASIMVVGMPPIINIFGIYPMWACGQNESIFYVVVKIIRNYSKSKYPCLVKYLYYSPIFYNDHRIFINANSNNATLK